MSTFYAVTAVYADGQEQVSRFFDTLRAARKWAKWLTGQTFTRQVRIMAGGAGGMEVK